MRRSEEQTSGSFKLDLEPPVRLDLWAITLASGIILGTVAPPLGMVLLLASLVVAGAVLLGDFVPRSWWAMALLGPLFAASGLGIAALHASAPDPLAELAGIEPGKVTVIGDLASPPEPTEYGYRADLRVERLLYEGEEVLEGGKLRLSAANLNFLGVGDGVRLEGELSRPDPSESSFNYTRYLSTKGISAVMYANRVEPVEGESGWIGRVHSRTETALGYGLRPPEDSVVRAMTLGDRSRIPEELQEDFRHSGITHILAISGQHVAILTALVYFVLRGFAVPLAVRNPATLGLVWLYVIVAGMPPSATRAGVIATLVLIAPLLGRQLSPVHFMTAMLAAVLAYNPELIYSVGFQLSVAAVFGILLFRKPLQALLKSTVLRPAREPPRFLLELLSISLAAQISTAPIIAATFELVPVLGVFTNLIAVPLSAPILALGFLASLSGNVILALAYPLNYSNGFLIMVVEWVAQAVSSLPFATVATSGVPAALIALFYAGCVPAALSERVFPEERWPVWGGLLLAWTASWIALASVLGG